MTKAARMTEKPRRSGKTSRTARVREDDYTKQGPHPNETGHLPWLSVLSPSGLAPAICNHGLKVLPSDHPRYSRNPRLNEAGGESPPQGRSWVRAKYIMLDFKCVVCHGRERPADLTKYRETTVA